MDVEVRVRTSNLSSKTCKSRAITRVTKAIPLLMELGRDFMVLNICRKFEEDWSKDVEVRAQTNKYRRLPWVITQYVPS